MEQNENIALFHSKAALDVVSHASEGIGFSISKEMADEIISHFSLVMKQASHNLSGETSAIFQRNGTTLRLELNWMKSYRLYHGEWKPDPHWKGD